MISLSKHHTSVKWSQHNFVNKRKLHVQHHLWQMKTTPLIFPELPYFQWPSLKERDEFTDPAEWYSTVPVLVSSYFSNNLKVTSEIPQGKGPEYHQSSSLQPLKFSHSKFGIKSGSVVSDVQGWGIKTYRADNIMYRLENFSTQWRFFFFVIFNLHNYNTLLTLYTLHNSNITQ